MYVEWYDVLLGFRLLRNLLTVVLCMCFMFVLICVLFMVLGFVLLPVLYFVLSNDACFLRLGVVSSIQYW